MTITTMMLLAGTAPLAIGLLCAYIGTHLAHVSHVPTPAYTQADFEAGFDRWAEYRASEEAYNARMNGEK